MQGPHRQPGLADLQLPQFAQIQKDGDARVIDYERGVVVQDQDLQHICGVPQAMLLCVRSGFEPSQLQAGSAVHIEVAAAAACPLRDRLVCVRRQ